MPNQDYDLNDELARKRMSEIAFGAAIGAALMLFFAFYLGNLRGLSTWPLYNFSVAAFSATLWLGGVARGLTAVGLWLGWRLALLIDAILSFLIGALLVMIGVIWLADRDWEGFLQIIFGLLFLRSGKVSWNAWCGVSVMPGVREASAPPEDEEDDSGPSPSDAATRQAALNRLLAAKKRERKSPAEARKVPALPPPISEYPPADVEHKTPQVPPARQASALRPDADPPRVPSLSPEPVTRTDPPIPTPSAETSSADEPPPEGFLAQLGKDD